ncbi:MAG: deoxyribose-phosphate aldolase [Lachnospiraceae bacterium]
MMLEHILSKVDHTVLKAITTWEDIKKLCEEAKTYKTASICIPPSYVKRVKEEFGDQINICTVIGFPLGYNTTRIKVQEAKQAIAEGASEIDMVINIGAVKNKEYEFVLEEIIEIREATRGYILKVIIEDCYLDEEEKISLCKIVTKAGADYIKTSTGFGTSGATKEDVILMKEHIGENVKIKAAGGIRSVEDMEAFIELGCDRLGTSSAIELIKGNEAKSY